MRFLSPLRIIKWLAIIGATLFILQLYYMLEENHEKSKWLKEKYRARLQNSNKSHPLLLVEKKDGDHKEESHSFEHPTTPHSKKVHIYQDSKIDESKSNMVNIHAYLFLFRRIVIS